MTNTEISRQEEVIRQMNSRQVNITSINASSFYFSGEPSINAETLKIENLNIRHDKDLNISYPNIEIEPAAQVVITGASGTGKTTLLNLIAGLEKPYSGSIFYGQKEITHLAEKEREQYRREKIGYVFQDFYLMSGLTVQENIELSLRIARPKFSNGEIKKKSIEMLERLDLAHRLSHQTDNLSTGERQRVAIARACVHCPALLLVDEPTAHLDRQRASGALDLIRETAHQMGATLLVVTHDILVAESFYHRLVIGADYGRDNNDSIYNNSSYYMDDYYDDIESMGAYIGSGKDV